MRTNSKKCTAVFSLAAFLLATLLVVFGCGGGGGGGGGGNTNPSNNAPTASNSAITVDEDNAGSGTMSASDADGDTVTFSIVTAPTMGAVNITNASTGAFTYTPNAEQNGSDSFTFKVSDGQADSNTATVTVTINPVNDTPTASAPAAFSADELSTVSLPGTGSDIEDGQALTYSWTQTSGQAVTIRDADQATAQFSAPAVETGSSLALSFKLTVTDSGSLTAEDTVDVTINAAGHIIGTAAPAPYHTNLTQEGTLDWAAWGIFSESSYTPKDGGTGAIPDFTPTPGSTITRSRSTSGPVAFSWTDGYPPGDAVHHTAKETHTRVLLTSASTGIGEGLRLTIPAGVEDKILKVYLGAYDEKGKVTVSLASDPSVTYTVSLDSPHQFQDAWVVTVLFGAATDGDQLLFDYTVEADTGNATGGHINIAAATLMPAQAMTPTLSPLPGTYTDPVSVTMASLPTDATIRFTQDGSQPTGTSSIYTGAVSLSGNATINAKAVYSGLTDSAVTSGAYTIDTTATGTLMANAAPAPYHTNLTEEGTLDWAAWGIFSDSSYTPKDGGTGSIPDFSAIGSITRTRSTSDPVAFSWTDGYPPGDAVHHTAEETPTRVLLTNADVDEGLQLTIPANDVEKTLRVFLGAYSTEGKVTVFMEDGSTPIYTTTLSSPDEYQKAWVVTVDFAAPSGTTSNLIFRYVRGQDLGDPNEGHISIAAASLTDQ